MYSRVNLTHQTLLFTINETTIVITATSEPDHLSSYYPTNHVLYEAYVAGDFTQNPNSIISQTITMTIPRYTAEATTHESTPMGTRGISVNSVSLYN